MTDADKTALDHLEREALALLERATFSIRDAKKTTLSPSTQMRKRRSSRWILVCNDRLDASRSASLRLSSTAMSCAERRTPRKGSTRSSIR
jgi:hypothetical protein